MRDHAVVAHQRSRDLMMKVAPLVGDVQILLSKPRDSLRAPIAPLLLARHRPLRAPERRLCLAIVLWRCDLAPIRRHQKDLEAKINARGRQWRRRYLGIGQLAGKDDMPSVYLTLERDGLDRALDGPMQLDLDVADVLDVDQRSLQLAAVPVGRELQGIKAILPLEAGIARRFSGLKPAEERLEGAVQAAQGGLATREVGSSQMPRG